MKMSIARFASTLAKSLRTHDLVPSCRVLLLVVCATPKRTGFLGSRGHQISRFFSFWIAKKLLRVLPWEESERETGHHHDPKTGAFRPSEVVKIEEMWGSNQAFCCFSVLCHPERPSRHKPVFVAVNPSETSVFDGLKPGLPIPKPSVACEAPIAVESPVCEQL